MRFGSNNHNVYKDPNRFNIGIIAPTWPPYSALNNLPDSTNIYENASISPSSASYHASSFTNLPQSLQDHEYNMQLNAGRTYNVRFLALRQPPQNMFSGSIYQAPGGGMHEGYTNNIIDSQSNNPQ